MPLSHSHYFATANFRMSLLYHAVFLKMSFYCDELLKICVQIDVFILNDAHSLVDWSEIRVKSL